MTEKLYRIKPMVWNDDEWGDCISDDKEYRILKINGGKYHAINLKALDVHCTSLEDGKAKCEAHRIRRLERDLEEVK